MLSKGSHVVMVVLGFLFPGAEQIGDRRPGHAVTELRQNPGYRRMGGPVLRSYRLSGHIQPRRSDTQIFHSDPQILSRHLVTSITHGSDYQRR